MRVCDLCNKPAVDAVFAENAIISALKESDFGDHIVSDILDALKIKPSIKAQPVYGDICAECAERLKQTVADIVKANTDSLKNILTAFLGKINKSYKKPNENIQMFNSIANEAAWQRHK